MGAGNWTCIFTILQQNFPTWAVSTAPVSTFLSYYFQCLLKLPHVYVSICIYTQVSTWRPEGDVCSSGVTDSCKLPSMGVGAEPQA